MRIQNRTLYESNRLPEELGKIGNALSGNEIKLWLILKIVAASNEQEISEEDLFQSFGSCRETVFRYLRQLEKKQLIVRNRIPGRKGWVHIYTLNSFTSWFAQTGRALRAAGREQKKASYPGRDYIPRTKK